MSDPNPPDGSSASPELDRVIARCDQFEAVWKNGTPAGIEDELTEAPAAIRPRLFRELLALELELRQQRGERPAREEYRARFADRIDVIDRVFAEAGVTTDHVRQVKDDQSTSRRDPARNLLFGLLAFQNSFIDREALLAAFGAWVADGCLKAIQRTIASARLRHIGRFSTSREMPMFCDECRVEADTQCVVFRRIIGSVIFWHYQVIKPTCAGDASADTSGTTRWSTCSPAGGTFHHSSSLRSIRSGT